jgi:S1-C subfamily serine protease
MTARLNCPMCKAQGTVAPKGDGDVVACSACGQQFKAVAPKPVVPQPIPQVVPSPAPVPIPLSVAAPPPRPVAPPPLPPAPKKKADPPWYNGETQTAPPPRRRSKPVEREEEDDSDEVPVSAGAPTGLILGAGAALLVLFLAVVGAVVFFAFREPSDKPDTKPSTPVVAAPPKTEPVKPVPKPVERRPKTQAELAKIGRAGSVYVEGLVGRKVGSGSGFCVHKDGLFVTNNHVVENVQNNVVRIVLQPTTAGQRELGAKVIKRDPANDLALLQTAEGGFEPLDLGDSDALTELQSVVAFGFPFGRALATEGYPAITVSEVKVSSLRTRGGVLHRIQLNGTLNPGNSGCPVLDESGRVIGVVVSGIPGSGIAEAIPVNIVRDFLTK